MDKPNILIDPLPSTLIVDGREFSIETGFRTGILFEQLTLDSTISSGDKVINALNLYFLDEWPEDKEAAIDAILWFYSCGAHETKQEQQEEGESKKAVKKAKPEQRIYDYDVDAGLIYAAFLQQYRIDLTKDDLHWWQFIALFNALSSDCELCRIMGYRAADPSKIKNSAERSRIARLKAKYALPCNLSKEQKVAMAGAAFRG